MKKPKYKYFADWDGGSLISDTLKQLCASINTKFSYLNTHAPAIGVWTTEDYNTHNVVYERWEYHRNNSFIKGRNSVIIDLLGNFYAYANGYSCLIKLSRLKIN